jgi:GR25 family glycosyltransferase involved in LPS biosynthesis
MDSTGHFPPCYVLTAPHGSGKRAHSAGSQLQKAGIKHSFVRGFGPDSMNVAQSYSRARNLLFMKRSLTRGEIAAYLGHKKIWEKIASGGEGCALVLEDDFMFANADTITENIQHAVRHLKYLDLIKLFDFRPREPIAAVPAGDFRIAVYTRPNSGLVGYLITADCCRKLLKRSHVFRPVDEELRYWFELGIRIGSTEPNLVFDNGEELEGSLLQDEREKMRHRKSRLRSIYANILSAYVNLRSWRWSREVARQMAAEQQRQQSASPAGSLD